MKQYLNLVNHILTHGEVRNDRTGTGTISVFSPPPMRFDLREGFPLVTTKFTSFHNIKAETLWILSGNTNVKWLKDRNCHIWDSWQLEDGTIGKGYGYQLRHWEIVSFEDNIDPFEPDYHEWGEVDQIKKVIDSIKANPYSRRHLVSMWNVAQLDCMALPPCHVLFQFYVSNGGYLSCHLYQRSMDFLLGASYNIAGYSLLTHMVAQVTGLKAGELTISMGDAHIYLNHVEQVKELLTREPLPLPTLWLNPEITDIDGFTMKDIKVVGYNSHPAIKGEVAV